MTTPPLASSFTVRPYGDPWWDNAITNLHSIMKEARGVQVELNEKGLTVTITDWPSFLKSFISRLKGERDRVVFVRLPDKDGVLRYKKKPHILLQYGKASGGRNVVKAALLDDQQMKGYLEEAFSGLPGDRHRCVVCGRRFGRGVEPLKQGTYPLVTKIRSLSGVRTHGSLKEYYGKNQVCPVCSMIGVLEWTDRCMLFIGGLGDAMAKRSLAILPVMRSLPELASFKDSYRGMLDQNRRQSNIGVATGERFESPRGPWSLLLLFYEKLFDEYARRGDLIEDIMELPEKWCSEWLALSIPEGQVKNVTSAKLPVGSWPLQVMARLLQRGEGQVRPYTHLLMGLYARRVRTGRADWDATWGRVREGAAHGFLTDDLESFTEALSLQRQTYVALSSEAWRALDPLLLEWRCKKMGIGVDGLASIKSAGNLIAEIAQNHAGALYKLERVRNVDEFWSALREISRRMISLDFSEVKVNPTSLDDVVQLVQRDRDGWQEVRDLLVIYSCVYYAVKTASKQQKGKGRKGTG